MSAIGIDTIERIHRAFTQTDSITKAARIAGVSWHTASRYAPVRDVAPDPKVRPIGHNSESENGRPEPETFDECNPAPEAAEVVLGLLKRRRMGLGEVAERLGTDRLTANEWLEGQKARGVNLECFGGSWAIEKTLQSGRGAILEYVSRPDNTFLFGACGDSHLGSKYARLDVLNRLYDRYEEEGVDRVFHTGNWIDGEASFNKYDLCVHGMDAQLQYLAENHPYREGVHTYAVAGDDHEGWYAKSSGVDIGRYAERTMQDRGRDDWHNLGYMESFVKLVNANSGESTMLAVVHPGGGSAYAVSYTIQKIVESHGGAEKPAVGLYGHYHKMWAGNIRNVWTVQTGCCQDQTPFMRKKRLEAHVGGYLVKLKQDPRSGAIVEMTPTMLRYFNAGFYNDRWSMSGDVVLPAMV